MFPVLRHNPQLEGFAARGIEVLLLTDPIDEFWPQSLTTYKDFPVKTVAAGAKELETLLITDQTGLEEKAPDWQWSTPEAGT